MSPSRWVLRSRRVVTPRGIEEADVLVEGEKIAGVLRRGSAPQEVPVTDAGSAAVLPGLFDSHVHINEPGRTEWEGFETATRAAAAAGITALAEMPLNSVPATTTLRALEMKLAACREKLRVDCGFWGGLVPGNLAQLEPLAEAGVCGFKAFLVDSGIPEFPPVGETELAKAMPLLARLGAPLLVHAELAGPVSCSGDPRLYSTYLASRPKAWENEAVRLLERLCRETGCRTHVVHLSSAEAIETLARAKREGLPLSAETCPHYLCFSAEEVPEGRTEFKCSPPIREAANRERLWEALREGLIGCVVSDHSPCGPELKRLEAGDFLKAWGGIASLQLLLPAVWTGARQRGFELSNLAAWLCSGPAELAGWSCRKGRVAEGMDADLVVFDPEAEFRVEPGLIRHRHPLTPYQDRRLTGAVEATWLRGEKVFDRGGFPGGARGETLLKKRGVPVRNYSAPPTENSPPRRGGEFPTPSPGGRASVLSEGDMSSRSRSMIP